MANTVSAKNEYEEIAVDQLLYTALKKKDAGLRLAQACVAYVNEKFELTYTFTNDETYDADNVRIVLEDLNTEVPSISDIFPNASFYENEMHELFDVNVRLIGLDYHDRLYRIKKDAPMLPEEARERLHEERKAAAVAKDMPGSQGAAEEAAAPAAEAVSEEKKGGEA